MCTQAGAYMWNELHDASGLYKYGRSLVYGIAPVIGLED